MSLSSALVGGLFGAAVAWLIFLGGKLYGRLIAQGKSGTVFGFGDVYLMALGGLVVGFPSVVSLVILAIIIGGCGALLYLAGLRLRGRTYQRYTALPYGPYILAATWSVLVFQLDFMSLLLRQ